MDERAVATVATEVADASDQMTITSAQHDCVWTVIPATSTQRDDPIFRRLVSRAQGCAAGVAAAQWCRDSL